MIRSRVGILAVVVLSTVTFAGFALASPPVEPPQEGYVIRTTTDVNVIGDFIHKSDLEWTYMQDTDPNGGSTLAHGDVNQALAEGGRAAQIRYENDIRAIDGLTQFNANFNAASHDEPNLQVVKDFYYEADPTSGIANASDTEKVGLSIVANGDGAGLGDMPSLCPWAAGTEIPATNEFIAMGSRTTTMSQMYSHTETDVTATGPPSINHSIHAEGFGSAEAEMRLSLMEGDGVVAGGVVPDLASLSEYEEYTGAFGQIVNFDKTMHYHSEIPALQMPEPWYLILP